MNLHQPKLACLRTLCQQFFFKFPTVELVHLLQELMHQTEKLPQSTEFSTHNNPGKHMLHQQSSS